ncbi:MAG: winged helix-turn-helix transcriptional regulator, partial [Mobilitalea sp.]
IVHREQYNEVPVRVEYKLAPNGFEMLSALNLLNDWGNKYISGRNDFTSHCPTCLLNENSTGN